MTLARPVGQWGLPVVHSQNSAFWTGGADGSLHLARCRNCATFLHPPAPVCWSCYSSDVGTASVSGHGTVYSYTVNHQPWDRDGSTETLYAVAVIELDEQNGLRLLSNVVGCDVKQLEVGTRVRVRFQADGDVFVPVFEPFEKDQEVGDARR